MLCYGTQVPHAVVQGEHIQQHACDDQVVGESERAARTVNVRTRDNQVHGMRPLAEVTAVLLREKAERSLGSLFGKDDGLVKAGGANGNGLVAPVDASSNGAVA